MFCYLIKTDVHRVSMSFIIKTFSNCENTVITQKAKWNLTADDPERIASHNHTATK